MNKGLQNCDAVAASPRKPNPIMNEMEAICKEANVADEALRSLMERLGPVMNLHQQSSCCDEAEANESSATSEHLANLTVIKDRFRRIANNLTELENRLEI